MLEDLVCSKSQIKVIDYLLDEPEIDFCMKDLVLDLEIGWAGLKVYMEKLEKIGLIKVSRSIKGTKLFCVNSQSELFRQLKRVDNEISVLL